jgi:hypothetical protein
VTTPRACLAFGHVLDDEEVIQPWRSSWMAGRRRAPLRECTHDRPQRRRVVPRQSNPPRPGRRGRCCSRRPPRLCLPSRTRRPQRVLTMASASHEARSGCSPFVLPLPSTAAVQAQASCCLQRTFCIRIAAILHVGAAPSLGDSRGYLWPGFAALTARAFLAERAPGRVRIGCIDLDLALGHQRRRLRVAGREPSIRNSSLEGPRPGQRHSSFLEVVNRTYSVWDAG